RWYRSVADEGALTQLSTLPSYEATEQRDGKFLVEESWATVVADPWVIGVNTDLVDSDIAGYEDVLGDEQLSGRVGVLDGGSHDTGAILYIELVNVFGDEFLNQLGSLNPTVHVSSTPMVQSL